MPEDTWWTAFLIVAPFVLCWCCCVCCSEIRGDSDVPIGEACVYACGVLWVPGCWTNPLAGIWEYCVERRAAVVSV